MAHLGEEVALKEERADFIRAVWTNELSVEVLWKFLVTEVPNENDRLSNKWWMDELPKYLTCKKEDKLMFQVKDIKTKPTQEWDVTVLAFAIQNCLNLLKKGKQTESGAVKNMKVKRDAISHKRHAKCAKPEFNELFIDLDDSYTSLLGESEAKHFCEELKKIKEKQIYDKWTEGVLAKRDDAVCNAEGREEVIMKIHTELEENIKKRVKQNEDDIVELNKRQDHLESRVDEISRTTTVHKGSDGAGVQADGPDPVPQERGEEQTLQDSAQATASVPTQESASKLDNEPTLPDLLCFDSKTRESVNIITEVGTKYQMFGILLLDDKTGAHVQSLIKKHHEDSESINLDIVHEWLQGRGAKPVSWRTLTRILKKVQLNVLAQDITDTL